MPNVPTTILRASDALAWLRAFQGDISKYDPSLSGEWGYLIKYAQAIVNGQNAPITEAELVLQTTRLRDELRAAMFGYIQSGDQTISQIPAGTMPAGGSLLPQFGQGLMQDMLYIGLGIGVLILLSSMVRR